MSRAALAAVLLALAAASRAEPKLAGAGVAINRSASASGGGLSSGGGLALDAIAGESGVVAASAGTAKLAPGLMPLIAQPGSVTSITAVTKDTDSLTLAWTSPGLDGAQGSVVAGYYRIDASSDPLHVFDPTVFTVEIPTTTNPGDAQRYTLTGLLPNTTYYSRIYLADARKAVAETSAASAESSLAKAPAAPFFSGVFPSSVAISWTLPAGGAEGYALDGSTSNFLGGTVVSSRTANGVSVTLTIPGLSPNTTYYFKLASLNWQSDVNFASVLSTCTGAGGPAPVASLALSADNLNRLVTVTWTNPVFANPAGVTVLVSTNPISATLADGTAYPPGTTFADGSVVRSTGLAASFLDSALALDVTSYLHLYSRDTSNNYSVAVTTSIVLDLPPMAPAGLTGTLAGGGATFGLSWAGVRSSLDGTSFFTPAAPTTWELERYDVYRATGIVSATWVWIGSTTAGTPAFAADVPTPGTVFYYKVVARDAFLAGLSDDAMAIDTTGALWAVHRDGITRLRIPASAAAQLTAAGNASGQPLLVRARDRAQDLGGKVLKSVDFTPTTAPGNQRVRLPNGAGDFAVALHYDVANGAVVPSGVLAVSPDAGTVSAANASNALAAYFVDNGNAAKLFGRVDPNAQEVQLQSGLLGGYQIRATVRDGSFDFDPGGVSNRALTPNGDGLNDTVVFTFNNPKDSAFTGKIFDVRGRFVADMTPGPVAGASLLWDGKAGGQVVPRGVYIYQIQAEGKTFNGTVVVIR